MIIFLHSVVPHVHHDQISDAQHEEEHLSADSWKDYIKLIFHTDLGDGHLEHFNSADGLDLQLITAPVVIPVCGIVIEHRLLVSSELRYIVNNGFIDHDDPLPAKYFNSPSPLRGPPFIS